jgi:hypothetical protein
MVNALALTVTAAITNAAWRYEAGADALDQSAVVLTGAIVLTLAGAVGVAVLGAIAALAGWGEDDDWARSVDPPALDRRA